MLGVSHSPKMVTDFCDRAIWLHHGSLILDGPSAPVLNEYLKYAANPAIGLPARESADRAVFAVQ
jgi:ABC-type polysaccharide/polyol phosphate transport system ATPase subunit